MTTKNTESVSVPAGFEVLQSRSANFDWHTLFNGSQHILTQGTDYTCSTDSMIRNAKQRAKAMGADIVLAQNTDSDPQQVLIQATSPIVAVADDPKPEPEAKAKARPKSPTRRKASRK